MKISIAPKAPKFCRKCDRITPRNTSGYCSPCQARNGAAYRMRLKEAGGPFKPAVKVKLIADHPLRCPKCSKLWDDVPPHRAHPKTKWHFDHHVSPKMGGKSILENARIMCWPCNLEKN